MMVASVTAQAKEFDPSKAFDLGIGTPSQCETPEMYDLDDFPKEPETLVTSAVPAPTAVQAGPSSSKAHPHNRDLKERCVMWALSDRKDIKYNSIFMIHGDIHFEVVRKQFRSMRSGKEVDAAVIMAYSLVLDNEPIPRFQTDVYILPPSALSSMMERYRENYIDLHTRKVHSIRSLKSDEHLRLVNKNKLITHRYEKKTFFVVDSKRKDAPSSDKTKINKFAGNMIDQLLVGTRSKPPQISWFPRYQQIHEQLNAYDCGTFVMKWMELLDPTKLDAHSKYPIEDWSTEDLQGFRNEIIWQIILSSHNQHIQKAIQGAIETTIHKSSAALRSPYVQVNTDELKKLS
ncbi:hypothetical protein PIB30_031376 [Stylosanthes scabra]|uniref:Ubiquitin-like protease family profile domain-containing protein n=1 Tax=Stylosanthes scabra TaxID=79078 RepID=A0ABU6W9W4_9FABA|nr:hypothetical protein [Stylosanthes scabra]